MFLSYPTLYLFHYQKVGGGAGAGAGGGGAGAGAGGGADWGLDIIRDQGLSAKRTPSTWFIFLKCLCDDGSKKR